MRKTIVVLLAVAIIGGLGTKVEHNNPSRLQAPTQSVSSISQSSPSQQSMASAAAGSSPNTSYKDGTYTGDSEDTLYGTVQIAVVVSGGKITDVNFLQMPGPEDHSREITTFAEPILKQETISSQSSSIQFVSGASTTSAAYEQSLQAALNQAA